MAKYKMSLTFIAMGTCIAFSNAGIAAEGLVYEAPDHSVTILGGIGYAWLKSNEGTYDEFGRISQLIWKTDAPVVTAHLIAEVADNWKVMANATIGFSGNSRMEDYDWLDLSPSSDFADWDHLSVHPDTDLDRYLDLDIAAGRDFAFNDGIVLNLHGGLKYTNVKWTARGGSFIYSEDNFRDSSGNFPDGERVATFEQRYPGLFVGAQATAIHGDWTFTGLVRGGATIDASDTDRHWVRGLRFERDYSVIPFVSLSARADYHLTDRVTMFIGANFDKYFHRKGDTNVYAVETGELLGGPFVDGSGMDFVSTTINVGFKASF